MLKLAILLAAVAVCYGQERTQYLLFTRGNPRDAQRLDTTASDKWLADTNLDPSHKTIILIHGHHGKALDEFTRRTRDEIFDHQPDELNIVVVDWENSAGYNYATASANVQLVANDLTAFMKLLTELQRTTVEGTNPPVQVPDPLKLADLHLVGFDLGAHVAGIASRQVTTTPLGLVGRITGLDPAGSRWDNINTGRLRESDASYVEVIHTDGSGLLANGIGTPIGQINFYANGGNNQPGCLTHSCSHNRAWELFAASMRNPNLRGNSCSTMTQMNLNLCRGASLDIGGIQLSKTGVSIYRINTGRNYPF